MIISVWKAVKYPSGTLAVEKTDSDMWLEVNGTESFAANVAHILNSTSYGKLERTAAERRSRGIPEVESI
jgi:hypothetical protein